MGRHSQQDGEYNNGGTDLPHAVDWVIPKKYEQRGVDDILFWERPLEILDLSLYSWKFQTN